MYKFVENTTSDFWFLQYPLRNSIDQIRLSYLAVISINFDMLKHIAIKEILDNFLSTKQRRLKFSC